MTDVQSPSIDAQGISTLFQLERWQDIVTFGQPLLAQADDSLIFLQVINAHWALGDYPPALDLIQQGSHLWPTEPGFHYYRGVICLDLGLIKHAERAGKEGLALMPDWTPLYGLMARVALAQHDFAAAKAAIDQALALEPSKAFFHYLHAVAQWNLNDVASAQTSLSQALGLDPVNSDYIALKAAFCCGDDREMAVNLLRQSLRINPKNEGHQKSLRNLTTLGRLDNTLAVAGVLLTAQAPLSSLSHAQGWTLVLMNVFIGLRLFFSKQVWCFFGFFVFNAAFLAWDLPVGLPALWRSQGPSALWSLETPAYLVGTCLIALGLALMLKIIKRFVFDSMMGAYAFLKESWEAWRVGLLTVYALDVFQRRGVQFNLSTALATSLCVMPPINLAISMLLLVFVLPIAVWLLGVVFLPVAARPTPSVIFMFLGFTLMLATFGFVSATTFDLNHPSYGLQALWALGMGMYALMVVNQIRRCP